MDLNQNDRERLQDRMEKSELTAAQANVQMVRMERVRLITSSVRREVRQALNAAVRRGDLGHVKKDGLKPEAYFHPVFMNLAIQDRRNHELDILDAVKGVLG